MDPIRVLIVDDHEMVREGLSLLLEEAEELEIVGQAGSVAQAVRQAALSRAKASNCTWPAHAATR